MSAQLVDRVIPGVPVRQWVLSLPFTLRYQHEHPPVARSPRPWARHRRLAPALLRRVAGEADRARG